jgi:hypothetical protein
MSSTAKKDNKQQSNAKGKEKEAGTKLPSVNSAAKNTTSTSTVKKGNDKVKATSNVEKLPEIKPSTPVPEKPAATNAEAVVAVTSEAPIKTDQPSVVTESTSTPIPPVQPTEIPVDQTVNAVPVPEPVAVVVLPPQNGKVILIYEQYNEQFEITNGSTTAENIDEVYCLSFVMPGCLIHLSNLNPQEKRQAVIDGNLDLFLEENPRGTYHGLEVDKTYYVYVEQEAEQLARDQAKMKQIADSMEGAKKRGDAALTKDDGRVLESCSCIYGNPCVDEYGCKDWANRCAVATKNGWKGF